MACTNGHKNAPQYFGPVVRSLLEPEIRAGVCVVYFEDIAGGGETFEEMLTSLRAVLFKLASHGVRLNLNKCCFGYRELVYTGFTVSSVGHSLAPSRLDPILTYPSNPHTLTQGRRLMGLLIQLSAYIKDFALMTKPIQDTLTKVPFLWTSAAESAFVSIKELIRSSDILHHIDTSLPLVVRPDASDKGVGAVLYQVDPVTPNAGIFLSL